MNTEQITQPVAEQTKTVIGESFCFHCHYPSISGTQNAFAYYEDHKKQQKELYKSSIPIAIDTNVLLELYSISFKERNAFLKFINENAHRIIITSQVQTEYMRHRISAIQSFVKTLKEVEGFPKKIQDSLKQAFDTALSQLKSNGNRPIVLNDMSDVPNLLKEVREFLEQHKFEEAFVNELEQKFAPLTESVKKGVEDSLGKAVYELNDPVLAALSKTNILEELSVDEETFLRERFDALMDEFNQNIQDINKKDLYTFPGCGDRKKLKEGRDPLGDFFIYHELLSYMKNKNQDVVYLTNDVTKSDWIKPDGKPFNHYIVDTYINTGHMLYIFNARDFTTLSFEAVAEVDSSESDDSTEDALTEPVEDVPTTTVDNNGEQADAGAQQDGGNHNDNEDADVNASAAEGSDTTIEASQRQEPMERDNNYSYLRDVSKERFMQELETALLWAESYGDGYVGKDYFVYSILGHKRFHFSSSLRMLDALVSEGLVVVADEEHDGHMVKCLKKAAV